MANRIPPMLVGLEHEFAVFGLQGAVDVADLRPRLEAAGIALRPDRPDTVRLTSGVEISWEADIVEAAVPPIGVTAGFTTELVAWAGTAASALTGLLPPEHRLEGRSTHLSVSVPERWVFAVCGLFARRFAPGLMLLTEPLDGEGLLVRPRFERVELCLAYARGDVLAAAAAYTVGGVLACLGAVRGGLDDTALPPEVDVHAEPAVRRFGWFLGQSAFGADPIGAGRQAQLRCGRHTMSANAHLAAGWAAAKRSLGPRVAAQDVRAVDLLVAGTALLPCECGVDRGPEPAPVPPRTQRLGERLDATTHLDPSVDRGSPPRAGDVAIMRATARLDAGMPPAAVRPSEPDLLDAALLDGLADPAAFTARTGVDASALQKVALYERDHVWPVVRPVAMSRVNKFAGAALLASGLGLLVGGLLPPRGVDRVEASPAATSPATAPGTTASRSIAASAPLVSASSAPACVVTSSVSYVRTDAVADGWIVLFPVEVRDSGGEIVVGAEISITNQKSDGTSTNAEGITGPEGIVAFGVKTTQAGENRIDVLDVRVPDCTWDEPASITTARGDAP